MKQLSYSEQNSTAFLCKVHHFPQKVPLFLRDILATLRIAKHHHPTLRDIHIIFFDRAKATLHKLIKAHFSKQQQTGKREPTSE